jgi:hypothetical protein
MKMGFAANVISILLLALCRLACEPLTPAAAAVNADSGRAAFKAESSALIPGIYILNPVDVQIPKYVLRLADVTGISLRLSWKLLEPEKGRFDWTFLDNEIAAAGEAGKTITLRVLPGVHSPDWLYELGAAPFEFVDSNPRHSMFGKKLRIPTPWDEIFLSEWKKLIVALGARYANNRNITIAHLTGPNQNSAEMHLPHLPADLQHWQEKGYTSQKLIHAWRQCIDAWAQALPTAHLSLNLSPAIFKDTVMEEVAQYGYQGYGRRFMLQNNALTAKPVHRRTDFGIIREYARKIMVGFQMLGMATAKSNPRQGDLRQSIDNGLAMGASYFEIYPHDAQRLPQVIKYGAGKLREKKQTL